MPNHNYKLFVQSFICQVSIKNNFLTLSKLFTTSSLTEITLRNEGAINITSQSCFDHIAPKHSPKKVKGVLAV